MTALMLMALLLMPAAGAASGRVQTAPSLAALPHAATIFAEAYTKAAAGQPLAAASAAVSVS